VVVRRGGESTLPRASRRQGWGSSSSKSIGVTRMMRPSLTYTNTGPLLVPLTYRTSPPWTSVPSFQRAARMTLMVSVNQHASSSSPVTSTLKFFAWLTASRRFAWGRKMLQATAAS